ncbi:hypothetical protein ACROYT_G008682 [Oculina patagonica]
MAEFLNPAVQELQQEELIVLQSIFEDDLQMLQGEEGQRNISFTLTVKVNIPYEKIDFEAFIPIFEETTEKHSARLDSSGSEPGTYRNDEDNVSRSDSKSHSDTQEEYGMEGSSSSVKKENENLRIQERSPNSFAAGGRAKRSFSRSASRRHWHVRADIQYLTPMHLTCTFPPLYPTECQPEFSLTCLWLNTNQIQSLQDKLMRLWTESPYQPIVFTWADWLQNYAYEYLRVGPHLVLKDTNEENQELDQSGTVLNLLCPNHDCKTMIPPEILRDVLDADKLERWERLLLSKTLDVMGDVVYCPRCNVAVVIDEDESSRLGHCANCFFAFCTECHEPWHARQECFEGESDLDEESAKNKNAKSKKKKDKKDGTADGKQKLQSDKERRKEMSSLCFIRLMKQQGNYQYCPKCRMAVERISDLAL